MAGFSIAYFGYSGRMLIVGASMMFTPLSVLNCYPQLHCITNIRGASRWHAAYGILAIFVLLFFGRWLSDNAAVTF